MMHKETDKYDFRACFVLVFDCRLRSTNHKINFAYKNCNTASCPLLVLSLSLIPVFLKINK